MFVGGRAVLGKNLHAIFLGRKGASLYGSVVRSIGIDVRRSRSELGSFVSRAFVDGFETGLRANTTVRVTWQILRSRLAGLTVAVYVSRKTRCKRLPAWGALLVVFERRFWFIRRCARFARANFTCMFRSSGKRFRLRRLSGGLRCCGNGGTSRCVVAPYMGRSCVSPYVFHVAPFFRVHRKG